MSNPFSNTHELPHLRINIFGNCNIRCIYCPPWGENGYTIAKDVDAETLKGMLKTLANEGFKVVKFTGGEPTLRKDIFDLIRLASELFSDVRVITNGWNLIKIAPELKLSGVTVLEVSLDAVEEKTFNKMTQTTDLFKNVISGLWKCKELEIPILINMVVTKANINQILPMVEFGEKFGNCLIKMLELVYYEFPGYKFWKEHFISMDEVIELLNNKNEGVDWLYPPGGVGSPMKIYEFKNKSKIIVKDGRVGSTYADICNGCSMFPCQDGLYGLSLTTDGLLKMCKHRPDLHIPLVEENNNRGNVEDDIKKGIQKMKERYKSLYFLEGWKPDVAEEQSKTKIVKAEHDVIKWYRKKEYGENPFLNLIDDDIPIDE